MKALVVNALSLGFDFEDVQSAAPMGREVLVDVQASGLCHTDLLFATHAGPEASGSIWSAARTSPARRG